MAKKEILDDFTPIDSKVIEDDFAPIEGGVEKKNPVQSSAAPMQPTPTSQESAGEIPSTSKIEEGAQINLPQEKSKNPFELSAGLDVKNIYKTSVPKYYSAAKDIIRKNVLTKDIYSGSNPNSARTTQILLDNIFKHGGISNVDKEELTAYATKMIKNNDKFRELSEKVNKGENRGASYEMGNLMLETGDPQQAINHFSKALASGRWEGGDNTDSNILYNIGRAYQKIGDAETAKSFYSDAHKADDKNYAPARAMQYLAMKEDKPEVAQQLKEMADSLQREYVSDNQRYESGAWKMGDKTFPIGESPEEIKRNERLKGLIASIDEFEELITSPFTAPLKMAGGMAKSALESFKAASFAEENGHVLDASTHLFSGLIKTGMAGATVGTPGGVVFSEAMNVGERVLPEEFINTLMAPATVIAERISGGPIEDVSAKNTLEIIDVAFGGMLMHGIGKGLKIGEAGHERVLTDSQVKGLQDKIRNNEPLTKTDVANTVDIFNQLDPKAIDEAVSKVYDKSREKVGGAVPKELTDLGKKMIDLESDLKNAKGSEAQRIIQNKIVETNKAIEEFADKHVGEKANKVQVEADLAEVDSRMDELLKNIDVVADPDAKAEIVNAYNELSNIREELIKQLPEGHEYEGKSIRASEKKTVTGEEGVSGTNVTTEVDILRDINNERQLELNEVLGIKEGEAPAFSEKGELAPEYEGKILPQTLKVIEEINAKHDTRIEEIRQEKVAEINKERQAKLEEAIGIKTDEPIFDENGKVNPEYEGKLLPQTLKIVEEINKDFDSQIEEITKVEVKPLKPKEDAIQEPSTSSVAKIETNKIETPEGFKNEIHESGISLGEPNEQSHITEQGYTYRLTGEAETKAIQETGGVHAKAGKAKGGRTNTKHWTRGNGRHFYRPTAQDLIRVKNENIKGNEVVSADNVEIWDKEQNKFIQLKEKEHAIQIEVPKVDVSLPAIEGENITIGGEGVRSGIEGQDTAGQGGKTEGVQQVTPEGEIKTMEYAKRVLEDPNVAPEVKAELVKLDTSYKTSPNKFTSEEANRLIGIAHEAKAIDGLVEDIKRGKNSDGTEMDGGVQSMLASKTANKLELEGRFKEAAEMRKWMADTSNRSGKFIQALSEQSHPEAMQSRAYKRMQERREEALAKKSSSGKTIGEELNNIKNNINKKAADIIGDITETKEFKDAIEKRLKELSKKAPKKENIFNSKAARDKKLKELDKRWEQAKKSKPLTSGGLDVEKIEVLGEYALVYIAAGAHNFALYAKKMKDKFSEITDDDIKMIWEKHEIENAYGDKKTVAEFAQEIAGLKDKGVTEKTITPFEKTVADAQKELGIKLKDAAKDFFENKEKSEKTLTDYLIEKSGLSGEDARALSFMIKKEFKKQIEEYSQNELTKVLGTTKLPILNRVNKTTIDKVVEAVNMGALNESMYADLFGEKFGFGEISDVDKVQIGKFVNELSQFPEGSVYYYDKIRSFADYLEKIDPNNTRGKQIYDLSTELFYTGALSGLGTIQTNFKGIIKTGAVELAITTAMNPRMGVKGFAEMAKAFSAGTPVFRQVMKDGFNYTSMIEDSNMAYSKLKKLQEKQKTTKNILQKAYLYPVVKSLRFFLATDAYAKQGIKGYYSTVRAYNDVLMEGFKKSDKDFWNKVFDKTHNSKAEYNQALIEAEGEFAKLEAKGEKIDPNMIKLRALQIVELKQEKSIAEYSKKMAERATLNGTPVGTLGAVYNWLKFGQNTIPLFKTELPFIKIATNQLDRYADFIPLWGFKRAAFGRGTFTKYLDYSTQKRGELEIGKENLTPEERTRFLIKGGLSTLLYTSIAAQLLEDTAEGEEAKHKTDLFNIRLSGDGYGSFTKNNEKIRNNPITKNWKENSIELSFNVGGKEFSTGYMDYTNSPFGMLFNSLGSIHDDIKYKNPDEKKIKELQASYMLNGVGQSLVFMQNNSYFKSLTGMAEAFSKANTLESRGPKLVSEMAIARVKSALYPNFYQSIVKSGAAIQNKQVMEPVKYKEGATQAFVENMINYIPYVQTAIANKKVDALGFPVSYPLDNVPVIPNNLIRYVQEQMDIKTGHREWELMAKNKIDVTFDAAKEDLNGRPLTPSEGRKIRVFVSENLGKYISSNYETLKDQNAKTIQSSVNQMKKYISDFGKEQLFGVKIKESNVSEVNQKALNKIMIDLGDKRTFPLRKDEE